MPGADHYCHSPIIFDLETAGDGKIIQIGALAPATGTQFEAKIKFNAAKADPKILAMNSYDPELWEVEAVKRKDAMEAFREFLGREVSMRRRSRKGHDYMLAAGMGWNAALFDKPLLMSWHKKRNIFFPMDQRIFDVYFLAMWMLPNLQSYALSSVAESLGVLREGAHDAIIDCEMTRDVAAVLLSEMWNVTGTIQWVKKRMKEMPWNNDQTH